MLPDGLLAQVVYVDLGPVAKRMVLTSAKDSGPIWREILLKLGLVEVQGEACYDTFRRFLQRPDGPLVALVFDECDSMHKLPAIFADFLICVRALSQARFQESRQALACAILHLPSMHLVSSQPSMTFSLSCNVALPRLSCEKLCHVLCGRLSGQMLVGTPRMQAAIVDALDGDTRAKLAVVRIHLPLAFCWS